jgi:phosphatidylglycerophosphatase A
MKKQSKIEHFIAVGFGLGLLPRMPGTWGTLAGVILYLLLMPFSLPTYLIIITLAFIFGCWLCERVAKEMNVYDHSSVVWDEIVGYCVAMIGAPKTTMSMIVGFILFRLFDIMKPSPIRWVDTHMKSGVGMMLDDVLAGLAVCILFQLYQIFI